MLFTGCITADAAVREVGERQKVTGFTVAINDRFKDREGAKKTSTTFVECSYWVNHDLAPYPTKGSVVEVFGRVEAKAWLDNENKLKSYLACTVKNVRLCGAGSSAEPSSKTATSLAGSVTKGAKPGGRNSANNSGDVEDNPF